MLNYLQLYSVTVKGSPFRSKVSRIELNTPKVLQEGGRLKRRWLLSRCFKKKKKEIKCLGIYGEPLKQSYDYNVAELLVAAEARSFRGGTFDANYLPNIRSSQNYP